MKKITQMSILSFAFAAACLLGCNEPEMEPVVYGESELISSETDTSKLIIFPEISVLGEKFQTVDQLVVGSQPHVPDGVLLHGLPTNLSFLTKLSGNVLDQKVKYVAVGSSLTAGVRDGGYFNEGMLTSYPNLIARQLGISDLKMPLFDAQDYNGTGLKIPTDFNPTGGPFPKFNISSNNLGIERIEKVIETVYDEKLGQEEQKEIEKPLLKKYRGYAEDLDVMAFPGLIVDRFQLGTSKPSKLFEGRVDVKDSQKDSPSNPLFVALMKKEADIFTIEMGSQGFVPGVPIFGGLSSLNQHPMVLFIQKQLANGAKGCVANVPDYSKFPVYHQVTFAEIQKAVYNTPISYSFADDPSIGFVPNGKIDSLMSPNVNIALKKLYIGGYNDILGPRAQSIKSGNEIFANFYLKDINIPIVDLYTLYEKILTETYVTDDGQKVDPSYPDGNFFSNDGLYPTPFGNAVIANEFIRTLNKHYKLSIPLIPTRQYLK